MEIDNFFDLLVLTVFFVGGAMGIGLFGSLYLIYKGITNGVVISYEELISDDPKMTNLQKLLTGFVMFLATCWFLFLKGEFFRFLEGVAKFYS